MSKRFRIIAPVVSFVILGGFLFAQKNPQNELQGTLEKLLRQLQDLQSQARVLQDALRQVSREARNAKHPLVVTSPGAAELPPPADPAATNLEKALAAYRHGIDFEDGKMCHAAIEAYSEAIRLDPHNDSAFLHRGYCYSRIGDAANAAADLTKSLSIQPNNSRAYLARATSYSTLGQNSLAMLDVEEALLRDPNSSDGLLLRGRLRQNAGEHDKAATDYTVALSLSPDTEAAYLGRAISLRNQGLHPLALADCDNAVRVNPNSPAGYLCRAESYSKTGAPDRAIEQLNQAVLAAQTLHQPLSILSDLMNTMTGNRAVVAAAQAPQPASAVPGAPAPEAVANPNPVPAAPPNPPAPPPAISVAQNAPTGQAIQPPVVAVSTTPTHTPTAASAKGNTPPGKVWTASKIDSAPPKADAAYYARLGRVRADESHFEDAIKAYDQAVRSDPTLAPAYNGRGYAELRLQNLDQALGDFSEALRLNPAYVNAYQNRSVARRLKGDRQGAMQDDQKVKEIFRTAGIPSTQSAQ